MKKTINPANWGGDAVEITINKSKKTVRVNGYLLELNFKTVGEHELLDVACEGQNLCSGHKVGSEYYLTDGYMQREEACPYTAAAQMACNML